MATDSSDRMRIVVYYAVWASVCAAAAGIVLSLIHTLFFSYHPTRAALLDILVSDLATALAIGAGQGAVALATGSLLARVGRLLERTVLLGLLVGVVDFVLNFVQMVAPATEFGWARDLILLAALTAVITILGSRSAAAAA